MHRLLSLMVVLAHLGVASVPCVEVEITSVQRAVIGGGATHSLPVAPARDSAHAGGHGRHAHPAEHARAAHDGHSSHSSHAAADVPSKVEATSRMGLAEHELRAPCLCGCSQRSNRASTTTPQPPAFAPLPAEPPRLVVVVPPVVEGAPSPWPRLRLDPPEHVPIAS